LTPAATDTVPPKGDNAPFALGRDLFAPVVAALATKRVPRAWLTAKRSPDVLVDSGNPARDT